MVDRGATASLRVLGNVRSLLALIAAMCAVGALAVVFTGSAANADPTPSPTPYPPVQPCALFSQVLTDNPNPTLQISGTGFLPNNVLHIFMHSGDVHLGDVTTNASGAFGPTTFSVPSGTSGTHSVFAQDESCPTNSAFTLHTPAAPSPPVQQASSGLAFTGFAVAGYSLAAVALIGGGVALLVVSRRRRSSH